MKIIIIIIFFSSAQLFAGDYMLYIADKNNTSKCAKNKNHWTLKTSKEVSSSLNEYFLGQKPKITILKSAFSNGHFHFCGKNEITIVLKELYKIKKLNKNKNDKQLNNFINKIESIN